MEIVDGAVAGEQVIDLALNGERVAVDGDSLRGLADQAEVAGFAREVVEVESANELLDAGTGFCGSGTCGARRVESDENRHRSADEEGMSHRVQNNPDQAERVSRGFFGN